MTREEFLLKIGVDTSEVATGLRGAGKLVSDFFGGVMRDAKASTVFVTNQAKTASQKYTEFWKEALAKQTQDAIARAKERRAIVERAEDEYNQRLQRKAEGARRYAEQKEREHQTNLARIRAGGVGGVTGITAGGFKVSASTGTGMRADARRAAQAGAKIAGATSSLSGLPGGEAIVPLAGGVLALESLKVTALALKVSFVSLAGVVGSAFFALNRWQQLFKESKELDVSLGQSVTATEKAAAARLETAEKYRAALAKNAHLFKPADRERLSREVASGNRAVASSAMKTIVSTIYNPKTLLAIKVYQSMVEYSAKKHKENTDKWIDSARKWADYQDDVRKNLRQGMADWRLALKNLKSAKAGRTEWTLNEIAALQPADLGRDSWKIQDAMDVLWMREEAKFAKLRGNDAYANQLLSRSDQLASGIGGLAASEIDPLIGVKEELAKSTEAAMALTEAALGAGIHIIPVNGR